MKQKQTHRCGEQFDGCQVGGVWEGWVKKRKGLDMQIASYKINSYKDVKDSHNIIEYSQ